MHDRRTLFARIAIVAVVFAVSMTAMFLGTRSIRLIGAPDTVRPTDYPAELLAAAAAFEETAAYDFSVIQRSELIARAGGPLIPIPDESTGRGDPTLDPAISPTPTPPPVDHLFVANLLTRGLSRPDGFAMEIRQAAGDDTDWSSASEQFSFIARDNGMWRGAGGNWFATDASPGNGFDPGSARRLPSLLRSITAVKDMGNETIDDTLLHRFDGTITAADWPGVVAADGVLFTESPFAIQIWLDGDGRLARMAGMTINLNEETFDLAITTVLIFDYATGSTLPPAPTITPQETEDWGSEPEPTPTPVRP